MAQLPPQVPFADPMLDPQSRRTSGLAVAALVRGLVSLLLTPLGLVAVILGIVALVSISKDRYLSGKGLAIAGIALGSAALVLSCVLIGILLPALGKARQSAREIVDSSNLRSVSIALQMYASNNKGSLPESDQDWGDRITAGGAAHPGIFKSPLNRDVTGATPSYLYFPPKGANPAPTTIVAMTNPAALERGHGHALRIDGSVVRLSKQQLEYVLREIRAGKTPALPPSAGNSAD